jgi:phospholipid/cholesterol/gamma-HCH transport system permease protein
MKTTGGTQGVGRATTQAVVVSSVLIIFCDFILSRALLWLYSGI